MRLWMIVVVVWLIVGVVSYRFGYEARGLYDITADHHLFMVRDGWKYQIDDDNIQVYR